jgi:hypothetical protein
MNAMNIPGFTAEASFYDHGSQYQVYGAPNDLVSSGGVVLPQLLNRDDWTTDSICRACGCTVSGFVCNCGLRPRPDKLECIRNGGPTRVIRVLA